MTSISATKITTRHRVQEEHAVDALGSLALRRVSVDARIQLGSRRRFSGSA